MAKSRFGFVSNSSSSSFIVITEKKYKKNKPLEVDISIKKDIKDLIDHVLSSKEDLDSYILAEYGWSESETLEKIFEEDNSVKKMYDNFLKYIEIGNTVCIGSVCNDSGDTEEEMLYENGFDSVIYSEGEIYEN